MIERRPNWRARVQKHLDSFLNESQISGAAAYPASSNTDWNAEDHIAETELEPRLHDPWELVVQQAQDPAASPSNETARPEIPFPLPESEQAYEPHDPAPKLIAPISTAPPLVTPISEGLPPISNPSDHTQKLQTQEIEEFRLGDLPSEQPHPPMEIPGYEVPHSDAGDRTGLQEDWDDLEEAEDDLIDVQAELQFSGIPNLSKGSEHSADLGGDAVSDRADAPIDWDDGSVESLEEGWDDDEEWVDGPEELEDPALREADKFRLDEFDADAQQLLWDMPSEDEAVALRRAREKAASIASALELYSIAERDAALAYLSELFEHLDHSSTFAALSRATEHGLDLPTLKSMAALRHVWMERPEWWSRRYNGSVHTMKHGPAAFTWILAKAVCLARQEYDPDMMIDDEWFDEWLILTPGEPGYLSFPSYIAVKIDSLEGDALEAGFELLAPHGGNDHFGNDFGWYRRLPDPSGAIRLGFRIHTPFDNREAYVDLDRVTKIGETKE